MPDKFEIIFLTNAREFLLDLDRPTRKKILFNIDRSKIKNDPEIFKKLSDKIWEFRTKFKRKQYRLIAFWDKRNNKNTLVICTHGFLKKTQKTPKKEIFIAEGIMNQYFNEFK
ncbi:MAG: type II toxin-antitoxin system RelE/ParE family toxin [Bacteroidales bacterium]|nr:type II toxin-antitoxin system RelE/ParE family toxin [Bacteroidales bacterium]